jgi:predicted house-cleaning noncanonical NTP pyrophosphatase (MazG superfamily)
MEQAAVRENLQNEAPLTQDQDSMGEQENTEINAPEAGAGEEAIEEGSEGADVALAAPIKVARQEKTVLEARIRQVKDTYAGNPEALIDELTALAEPILDQYSKLTSQFELTKFASAILLGTIVNELYSEVTKVFRWAYYTKSKFSGVSASTLLNYRAIASRPDSHPYADLGIAKVVDLISLTRNDEGEERIQLFLENSGVAYKPGEPLTSQLKDQIHEAIRNAKEAARKKAASENAKKKVPVTKLSETLQKHAGEFVKASDKDVEGLADNVKTGLAEVLRESLNKLTN